MILEIRDVVYMRSKTTSLAGSFLVTGISHSNQASTEYSREYDRDFVRSSKYEK